MVANPNYYWNRPPPAIGIDPPGRKRDVKFVCAHYWNRPDAIGVYVLGLLAVLEQAY